MIAFARALFAASQSSVILGKRVFMPFTANKGSTYFISSNASRILDERGKLVLVLSSTGVISMTD